MKTSGLGEATRRSPDASRGAAEPHRFALRWRIAGAVFLIVLATAASYANCFQGVFFYDDLFSIVENRSIRSLWPPGTVLSPPNHGETVSGRPLLNLSFALNYAAGGTVAWGYHAANLAIHILNALLLFGIVRRTVGARTSGPPTATAPAALPVALAVALLWTVHPLQTESVTYVVQRAESLVALFYLLTLYCVIRGATGARAACLPGAAETAAFPLRVSHPGFWYAAAVLACLLGMAAKEVMATAPFVVLIYDRTFLAGSFAEALRRRWGLYLGMAATWGLLAYLVISTGLVGRTAAVITSESWTYARAQPGVILHYLRLSFWPSPLQFGYPWPSATTAMEILPGAATLGLLAAATSWGLIRRKGWGFLGAWFFLILMPSSSLIALQQPGFEHRMYLPLAAVVTLVVIAGYSTLLALGDKGKILSGGLVAAACIWLGLLTYQRNCVYQSEISIWGDKVAKDPSDAEAHYNLGVALADRARFDEAIVEYRKALEIIDANAQSQHRLGVVLADRGRGDDFGRYQKGLDIVPVNVKAHNNLGIVLARRGWADVGIAHYQKALEIMPDFAESHNNLGIALAGRGQFDEAIAHFQKAVEVKPDFAEAHNNLGAALDDRGRVDEAIAHYRKALEIKPDYAEAHYNFGIVLAGCGRVDEAIAHYRKALEIKPDYAEARKSLAAVRSEWEGILKALAERREAMRLDPHDAALLNDTAWMLATNLNASVRNGAEAVELAQRALKLSGGNKPAILGTLAAAYAEAGRFPEAVEAADRALNLAITGGNTATAEALRAQIKLYQAGLPLRDRGPNR